MRRVIKKDKDEEGLGGGIGRRWEEELGRVIKKGKDQS